ncbi:hypothetical protein BJX68DRAFT_280130 [Aspergillus pseudodeflectus]|uniref:DUF1446-domain-containing protein n=1 Tax=Aspergillus pseudodeflectus TaxID=176178 RepID=A0ABR4JCN1_9EURO
MKPFTIFTPSPILGYGYDTDEFWTTVHESRPSAIILDGGSTDPGPYMLGTDKTICSRASYERDLQPILHACASTSCKFLLGSAGGAGTNSQVDLTISIINDLAEKNGWAFRVAVIKFKDDRELLVRKVRTGSAYSCSSSPDISESDVTESQTIVGQMGAEPFLEALKIPDVDIIIAGRSYDPAPFAAFSMHHGVNQSPAWHMGKIMECGGLCATPKGRSMLATMHQDSFELTPTARGQRCTPLSVAAHTFYEKTRPDRLPGPGGVLHLDNATYTQQRDGRTTLVKGSEFVPTPVYQVKLEGVTKLGYRTVFIGGIKDPILIRGLDSFLETVRITTREAFPSLDSHAGYQLRFHVYGRDAVMGSLESTATTPHEVGLLGEVVAPSQAEADATANFARVTVLHASYADQVATAGNFASPLTPLDTSTGPVFKFSIYNLVDVASPMELFCIDTIMVGSPGQPQPPPTVPQKRDPAIDQTNVIATRQSPRIHSGIPGLYPLSSLASVIRSKNSGPFEITLDVMFDDVDNFGLVRQSGILNIETVKQLYGLRDQDIVTIMFYEPALGWKCTFKRSWPQGSFGERDTFGCQQHAPLLSINVPVPLRATM